MHALRIVLIEDNRETAKMIEDFLHTNFKMAETIVYSSGEEAIEKTKITPELFIIDYYLDSVDPKALDGIQIMMRWKDEHDGAEDYVAKNSQDSFNRLEIAINNVLHNIQLQKDIVKQRRFIGIMAFIFLTLIAGVILTKVLN